MGGRIDRGVGAVTAPVSDEERAWLRSMMGRFATGVTVVAARHGPLLAGMTANAIATISMDPPLLMSSINTRSETHQAIIESHALAVSVLSREQQTVAECLPQPTQAANLPRF